MSQRMEVFYSSPVEEESPSIIWSTKFWVLVLIAVMLAGMALGTVSANEEISEAAADSQSVINSELAAVRRYRETRVLGEKREILAVNPELMAAQRYAEGLEIESAEDLSVNPELMVARRFSGIPNDDLLEDIGAWVANPELSAANRFAEEQASAAGASLYENPELKLMDGLSVQESGGTSRGYLSENPEVKFHQRFVEENGQ